MNKPLVITAVLVILGGVSFIAWQLLSSSADEEAGTNPTPVNTSTSSIDPAKDAVPTDDGTNTLENTNDQLLTAAVVAEYNTAESCWTIIEGNVYNITPYVPLHPGGIADIVKACGTDGTSLFEGVSDHQAGGARGILEEYYIGPLES